MYNLTVAEVHTFAVGEGDWVVHNFLDFDEMAVQEVKEQLLSHPMILNIELD